MSIVLGYLINLGSLTINLAPTLVKAPLVFATLVSNL